MDGSCARRNAMLRLCLGCFAAGFLVLLLTQKAWLILAPCHWKYDMLSPNVRCREAVEQGEWNYEDLRDAILIKKAELTAAGKISEMSVYFRDMTRGPRFGIGEYGEFQPASLLKLPVLIAFLHEADRNHAILDKTLSFTGSLQINLNVEASDETIQPNTRYTIRELLTKMIVYSDNYSYTLLTKELNDKPNPVAYHTFHDLGILRMMTTPKADFVSIQSYSNLFAVLYSTGYLSKDMSQFALELLSQATYKDGLVAGVPAGIRVAHKFGHRVLEGQDSQLHDCGIVYHPSSNYVLCVMTSGPDLKSEESAIADVSRIVYDKVSELDINNLNGVTTASGR